MVVLSIFMRRRYSIASNVSSSGRSHIGSLFANEDQNRLGRDVIDTEVARR